MTEFWSKAIEFLATTIGQSAVDALRQNSAVSTNISKLRATLPRARLLIERSECWRFRYKPIDELLPQVKEVVYEAEIRLDEYDSEKWRVEGANWRIPGELINNFKNWVRGFPAKVVSAQDALDHVCDELEKICNSFSIPENPNQFSKTARPITSSDHPKIYGRENELDDAIRLLRVTRMGKKGKLAILAIVGMGGVGKTTLAQIIYNDKRVQSYFNIKNWTCVSDQFDLKRMIKEIIEKETNKECNVTNLDLLKHTLKETVKSKRVLLVLDDIWSKDWQDLMGPMNEASDGSAIILTTRSPEHVECAGGNVIILDYIWLEGLEENIYWDFFKSCAGLEVDFENYFQLEHIAREICCRLKGSPLAAKTLGGLLRKRIDKQQWINIRDSKMWELKHGEHDIMPILQLSYQYLPSHLKKCFSFCSLYPKDYAFTDVELAKLWIMEDFIPIQENLKRMEDLALGYFHELKNSCFFHYKHNSHGGEKFVIHDLMHDVCQSINAEECYCLQEEEDFGKISLNIHHISVFLKKLNLEHIRKMHKFKKLHSLLATRSCGSEAIKTWFDEFTSIRRLSLSRCQIKNIPENIGNLKHLQYLDISRTHIQNLPGSFCTLYNLQHLDMGGCKKFSKSSGFPKGSNNLAGLQFFIPPVHLVPFITHMPNLLKAMQLYNLSYHINDDGGKEIENLKHLSGVRGFLNIRQLENVSKKEAAEKAELYKQEFLDTLRLHWDEIYLPGIHETHKEVLEGLSPHTNLRVLEIFNYNGPDLPPSWMRYDLPNLTRILFWFCSNYTVAQLPSSITELVIQSCYRLTSLQDCLQPNLLLKLKFIDISWCQELVLVPVESFCEFVYLEKLVIRDCWKLTCPRKMVLPPSMKVLHLSTSGELDFSIPSCLQNLISLEDLSLRDYQHIVSIPDEVTRNLNSLRRLYVQNCQKLQSIGGKQFLQSIKDCTIKNCPQLKKTWEQNSVGYQLSDALGAVAPSCIIPSEEQIPLSETPTTAPGATAAAAAAPSSPHVIPSYQHASSVKAPSTDSPSSSNVRKRKHVPKEHGCIPEAVKSSCATWCQKFGVVWKI